MRTGLISRIQRYSTKDGPGIRSTVFMQQCNLRCQWCANPETIRPGFNVFWFKERCRQCGTCAKAAVNNTITMATPGNGVNIDRKTVPTCWIWSICAPMTVTKKWVRRCPPTSWPICCCAINHFTTPATVALLFPAASLHCRLSSSGRRLYC